ncbi:hypothetical protein ACET3Z_010152 [Daucus carota]
MATINTITPQSFHPLSKPKFKPSPSSSKSFKPHQKTPFRASISVKSLPQEFDVIDANTHDCKDPKDGILSGLEREKEGEDVMNEVVGVFGNDGRLSFEGATGFSSVGLSGSEKEEQDLNKLIDRGINATLVLAASTFAVSKLLTIDHDYWHGWTLFEILRYAPQHNWTAYEEALKTNPVLAKMMISGVVYSLGDWIAQCVEGKPLFEFDRTRMFRSGLVGFTLHGSLSHYYYQFCETLFPFQDWWVVPAKVAFDQTVWAAVWNSIYYIFLGLLRLESPISIFSELKASFWPMLTAGWKLWPFAHIITYGVIPVEQRLLYVDCVELIWVTILSTISNEKSEARISEAPDEEISNTLTLPPEE